MMMVRGKVVRGRREGDGVQGNAGGNEVKLVLKVVGERREG